MKFTATITGGTLPIAGTVEFFDGPADTGTSLGTFPVGNDGPGKASVTLTTLNAGTHSVITAVYSGDTLRGGSTGTKANYIISKRPTTTSLASDNNPSTFGETVTFTATIAVTPTGPAFPPSAFEGSTVTFKDGATTLGVGTVDAAGQAFYTTSTLGVSAGRSITAVYSSATANAPSTDNFANSTSTPVVQVVEAVGTTTTLASSNNPSVFSQPVTFTATIDADSGEDPTTGTVKFYDGSVATGTFLGNGNNSDANNTWTLDNYSTLSVGSHTITAAYQAAGNFGGSDDELEQVVNPASTTAAVTSSETDDTTTYGQSVTFTATVTADPRVRAPRPAP